MRCGPGLAQPAACEAPVLSLLAAGATGHARSWHDAHRPRSARSTCGGVRSRRLDDVVLLCYDLWMPVRPARPQELPDVAVMMHAVAES